MLHLIFILSFYFSGLKSQSKRALSTPPRPPSRRGRVLSDKLAASSGVDPSAKTISVPVFHLCHKLLPGTNTHSSSIKRSHSVRSSHPLCTLLRSSSSLTFRSSILIRMRVEVTLVPVPVCLPLHLTAFIQTCREFDECQFQSFILSLSSLVVSSYPL